jgi:site-specific recombinase XerD
MTKQFITDTSQRQRVDRDFERFLYQERGLCRATVLTYLPTVKIFLSEHSESGKIDLSRICADDVTGFVMQHAYDHSHGVTCIMTRALRTFLRYLYNQGKVTTNLAGCVPRVANWQFSTIPKFLQPDEVERTLKHCSRDTSRGKRNYAILLLLARLGLRACEIVGLKLQDIDWEAGNITVRGKGAEQARLPLMQDVGEAIATYLKEGRPRCSSQNVFVRHQKPVAGLGNSSTVSWIVSCALERAQISSPHKGAHLFRHSLATRMLRQGASLAEIGEILRHRNPQTTAIYAKVDLNALRTLARPWPRGCV